MRARATFWLSGVLLVACAGAAQGGGAVNGARLFKGELAPLQDSGLACISCHSVTPGEPPSIGTNLSNIGQRAGTTAPNQSAEEYLREAIVEPDAFLAGDFQEGIHPRTYGQLLTTAQVNDLIAYMLTLQSGMNGPR